MKVPAIFTRLFKRSAAAGYNAATASPRYQPFATMPAPVSQTHAAAWLAGSRAAFAVGSVPLAASLEAVWVDSVITDAPAVQLSPRNRENEQAHQLWLAPTLAPVRQMVRSEFKAGEALAIMRPTRRGELRLQVLNPEQLDRSKNADLDNGGRITSGVEEDVNGEIVAYWILPDAPDQAFALISPARRVPAEDVIHYFDAKFPGQRRGISALAPVLTRLHEYEKLIDAMGARANTAALFGGFVTDAGGTGFGDANPQPPEADLTMEPGSLRILPVGSDIKFPNMPDAGDAMNLLKAMARDICAGAGVPYELATGDLSGTNYSSGKLGLEAFKRRIKAHRASLLVPLVLEPLYRRWTLLRLLTGQAASNGTPTFLFPEFASLEPKKEAEADVILLNAGLRSRAEIIAARGRDVQDVDSEISQDTFVPRATALSPENENAD